MRTQPRVSPTLGLALTLCALLFGGCQDARVDWGFTISGVPDFAIVGAEVRRGSCELSNETVAASFTSREVRPAAVAPLDPGDYCFEVSLYDERCVAVGRGQEEATLPTSFRLIQVGVEAVTETDADGDCLAAQSAPADAGL